MNKQKCRECGADLKVSEERPMDFKFGGVPETIIRKIYECTNPECKDYQRYAYPDCEHEYENKDYGKYMFEHCYFCIKCGNFVCYDSSG